MPSQREIRQAAIKQLYALEMGGNVEDSSIREIFWQFNLEEDHIEYFCLVQKAIRHMVHGRDELLVLFQERIVKALPFIKAKPDAEALSKILNSIQEQESSWSLAYQKTQFISLKEAHHQEITLYFECLKQFFMHNRQANQYYHLYRQHLLDFPSLKGRLEPVTAVIQKLQKVTEKMHMIEHVQDFPDHADLNKIRHALSEMKALKSRCNTIVDEVIKHLKTTDAAIATLSTNFEIERIHEVDRAVLRLACYEIEHTEIPAKSAINEALELAKRFSTSQSAQFINGILHAFAKKHQKLKNE